jgi:hypothetical protein
MKLTEPRNWMRRIIPAGYTLATLNLKGTSPLLMSSGEADRESELYRAFSMLGAKNKKSLDDEARLREMEWKLRLYLDTEIGPYIPGKNIKEMLRQASTKWRRGEDIKRSLVVTQTRLPLIYKGPRDEKGLWTAGFRYIAMVANNGMNAGRVPRCRPMFSEWALEAEIAFDPEDIDADFLGVAVDRTRKYGLGDYRPTFGSFDISMEIGKTVKGGARDSATKNRNAIEDKANKAFDDRVRETS